MFDPGLIARQQEGLLRTPQFKALFPDGLPQYTRSDIRALTAQVMQIRDDSGKPTRALTPDEELFVGSTQLRVTYDAPFFLEHFTYIDQEGHGLRPLYPLWESQTLVLERLGQIERQRAAEKHPDGLLVNVLKVRQVGVTTFGTACVTHRAMTQPYIRALVGSDIESQASYLFRMAERVYQHLPWFLQHEKVVPYSKDREIAFGNASSIRSAWGKTTRGALQDVGGKKGNIERGRTHSVVHISELATWDFPEQLDTALLPGIPISPATLVFFESTAELADDWWNRHWEAAKDGQSRFSNIFIPNYAVPSKYSLPPPLGWEPTDSTKAWIAKAEKESPLWFGGRTIHPTPAQAYWYEFTRAYYEKKGDLGGFFKEYPSDDQECFQYAGSAIWTLEQHEKLAQQARGLIDVWAVEPSRDIAELRRLPDNPEKEDRRSLPPLSLRVAARADPEAFPVPPGYGFRRLAKEELKGLQNLRGSVMAIWEYPRARGARRYVVGVDVSYGVGQDFSVITVTRVGTIEEPTEEVAQYVTNQLTPTQLAYVCDAIGHLYPDQDGIEALMAIECNLGPGLSTQDTLQLHLGYSNFYVWEYYDAANPDRRFSTKIGWWTTQRTRPVLLSAFHEATITTDPVSGALDYRVNSPITRSEMRHLIIPVGGTVGDASAAAGQHDDAIISSAIGYYIAYRLAGGEAEPIAERRRRRTALQEYQQAHSTLQARRDWRNSDILAGDVPQGVYDGDPDDDESPDPIGLYFDARSSDGEG